MKTRFFSAILALLGSVGLAVGQLPPPTAPMPPPPPMEPLQNPEPPEDFLFGLGQTLVGARFWVNGSYLQWWLNERSLPPLITRGSPNDSVPGAIGQPNTTIVFGGPQPSDARSGARFALGLSLNEPSNLSLEANVLFLPTNTVVPSAALFAGAVLARPYIDARTGAESAAVISSSSLVGGEVLGQFSNHLFGCETNVRAGLYRDPYCNLSLVMGIRYLELEESLDIHESIPVASAIPVFGADRLVSADHFGARNTFLGPQIGLETEYVHEQFVFGCRARLALGDTHRDLNINGFTAPANATGPLVSPPPIPSGLLALPTNSGNYQQNRFTALPELGASVGWRICDFLRLNVGYTLIYWGNVARAADQVDRTLNPTQIPSAIGPGTVNDPARPAFLFRESSFWVQGVNFTLEFRY